MTGKMFRGRTVQVAIIPEEIAEKLYLIFTLLLLLDIGLYG